MNKINGFIFDEILEGITKLLESIGVYSPSIKISTVIFLSICYFLANKYIPIILRSIGNYISMWRSFSSLTEFWSSKQIKGFRENYIRPRLTLIPPESIEASSMTEKESDQYKSDAIDFFKSTVFDSKDDQKFYIILGGSGMGKSALIVNLLVSYNRRLSALFYGKKVEAISLTSDKADDKIKELAQSKKVRKTILLIDAFDEDDKAKDSNWEERLNELGKLSESFHKVVFTARTQFFPTLNDEPREIKIKMNGPEKGFHRVTRYYLAPFTQSAIDSFLNKKYSRFPFGKKKIKKKRAKVLVSFSRKLMIRPFLLSYIDELVDQNSYVFEYQVYSKLIDNWLERESKYISNKDRNNYKNILHEFSTKLARNLYENSQLRNGYHINSNELFEYGKKFNIPLTFFEMRTKSLLNRNGNNYMFAHKSIFEFLLAKECIKDSNFKNYLSYDGLTDAEEYYGQLSEIEVVMNWLKSENIFVFSSIPPGRNKVSYNTIELNREQHEKISRKILSDQFKAGFNRMKIENLFYTEAGKYEWSYLGKLYSLKRVSYNKSIFNSSNFQDIKTLYPTIKISSDIYNYNNW